MIRFARKIKIDDVNILENNGPDPNDDHPCDYCDDGYLMNVYSDNKPHCHICSQKMEYPIKLDNNKIMADILATMKKEGMFDD